MQYLTTPDIPEGSRPTRYDYSTCRHFSRIFLPDDTQPDGKSRSKYTCVDCRRVRTMKVAKI